MVLALEGVPQELMQYLQLGQVLVLGDPLRMSAAEELPVSGPMGLFQKMNLEK